MASDAIDLSTAVRYFQETEAICKRDNGALWGVQLWGPLLFIDAKSRQAVANQPDVEGRLTEAGELYAGEFPNELNIANGVTDWAGVKWTTLTWPLPEDPFERKSLMVHELWHRIQDSIAFPASNPSNDHLDTVEGRYWLQLEWRALREALMLGAAERLQAVRDALCFRGVRRSLFAGAADEERALEMHEGLAQYTGVRLGSDSLRDAAAHASGILCGAPKNPTFVRSFAYASGPAYGLLLDASGAVWRSGLKPTNDLGILLQAAHSTSVPQGIASYARKRAKAYDGDSLLATETERQQNRQKQTAEYRARLVDGPVFILPNHKMSIQFDPRNLFPLGEHGTVYPTVRVTDVWGVLVASCGALVSRDWKDVRVAAPTEPGAHPLRGDGWTLELNEGWQLVPAKRVGDYTARMTAQEHK